MTAAIPGIDRLHRQVLNGSSVVERSCSVLVAQSVLYR